MKTARTRNLIAAALIDLMVSPAVAVPAGAQAKKPNILVAFEK